MSTLSLLLALLAASVSAQKPSTAGFISIDCGLDGVSSYTSPRTGIVFSSDEPYTSAGVNMRVSRETDLTAINRFYATVRSFPDGIRNCYTLEPVQPGRKYKINAEFLYGNYDGLRQSPTFDLYLGVNLWATVEAGNFSRWEIITVADEDILEVCLVKTGKDTPFISELDLRPLSFSMYNLVSNSSYAVVFDTDRKNYGGQRQIRFPDDIYDRGWFPEYFGKNRSTLQRIKLLFNDNYPAPEAVLQTASEAESLSDTLSIVDSGRANQDTYVYLHFAELQELGSNETREMIISAETLTAGPFRAFSLQQYVIRNRPPALQGGLTYSIRATNKSTLPPMINAVEIFRLVKMPLRPTTLQNVKAIFRLRNETTLSRNWQGDPCVPRELLWDGLKCSFNPLNYSTITSLNLSRSRLNGTISLSIMNLTSLTSLDLSHNNLTGEIPSFLGDLEALKYLNLESNNLTGILPASIYQRNQSGSIALRIGNNPFLCRTVDLCNNTTSKGHTKKKHIVPLVISVSGGAFLFLFIGATVFILKWKRKPDPPLPNPDSRPQQMDRELPVSLPENALRSEGKELLETDIRSITNNFGTPLAKGSSGTIYLGKLKNGRQVAVKVLSISSVHADRQFRAEADLLTRVHHRHLVSLLGYCRENMSLVYEFVSQGSLNNHLSGPLANENILSWRIRLRIALEAAQGIEYLHNGCNPPIIHRDINPSNILLTDAFEVKISNFGLSKSYDDGGNTFAPTIIAGTPGYLDPEYQHSNRLSEMIDVYSFGVVLLVLITAQPPLINSASITHISKRVRAKVKKGDLSEIADIRLEGNYEENSMWRAIEIALSCTMMNSAERPTMVDVVAQLRECLTREMSREVVRGGSLGSKSTYSDTSLPSIRPSPR